MTPTDEFALSHYQPVTTINAHHGVQLVQHTQTGHFFVKKQLKQYNLSVFRALRDHPVPDTPHIYELVEDGDTLIVIEEYLSGQTLQDQLEEHGIFSEDEAITLVLDLARIVQNLHHRNPPIIHRDIKPSNMIISPDHVLKLLDFNAAKFESDSENRDTVLLGTAGYAAPEQYGFAASGPQADIYSIGVIFNVLLTGDLPREKIAAGSFSAIIRKCTELNPRDRYASIDILINDLKRAQTILWFGVPETGSQNDTGTQSHGNSGTQACDVSNAQPLGAPEKSWRRFLPPGFRSGSPPKMAIAIMGYLILLISGPLVAIVYLAIILFTANYLDVQSAFPLTRSSRSSIRIFGIVLYDVILLLVGAVIVALL